MDVGCVRKLVYCEACDTFFFEGSSSADKHEDHKKSPFETLVSKHSTQEVSEHELTLARENMRRRLEGLRSAHCDDNDAEILLGQALCECTTEDPLTQSVARILKATGRLDASCVSREVSKFSAFYGAGNMLLVKEVMAAPLVDICRGLQISQPVPVRDIKTTGNGVAASLSPTGIFCSCCESEGVLEFVSLIDGRRVRFEGLHDRVEVAFVDNRCFLLAHEEVIKCASVELLMREGVMSVFKDVPNGEKIWNWCDVSTVGYTRALVYGVGIWGGYKTHEYNVDTYEVTVLPAKTLGYATMTGILNPHVKGIYSYDDDVMLLHPDGTWSTEYESTSSNVVTAVLPSESEPENFHKALIIENQGLYAYEDTIKVPLRKPFCFDKYISIVRLVKDIFIVFDADSSSWVAVRILVP